MNRELKKWIILVTYSAFLLVILFHLKDIVVFIKNFLGILTPFFIGGVIAFILNRPYEFFRQKVFAGLVQSPKKGLAKLNTPLSLIATYCAFLCFIVFLSLVIFPQIAISISALIQNIPEYTKNFSELVYSLPKRFNVDADISKYFSQYYDKIIDFSTKFISDKIPSIINALVSFTFGVSNFVLGFFISVYILLEKKHLKNLIKNSVQAFTGKDSSEIIMGILSRCNSVFSRYITGQITDSLLVGALCFLGCSLLGIPYALLVSTIICVTNIIPMFGPFIGAVPATLIILIISPFKALIFVIFVILLQQFDGNFMVPKIIGNSIGLSGLWVMFAIIVGSGLFGIPGLLFGVPAFAVIYRLISEIVKEKNAGNIK